MVTIQFSAPAIGGEDLLCSYTYTYTEVSDKCEASRRLHQQAKQDLHLENGMSRSPLLLIFSLYLPPLLDEDDTPTEQFYIECDGSFFMSGYAVIREI